VQTGVRKVDISLRQVVFGCCGREFPHTTLAPVAASHLVGVLALFLGKVDGQLAAKERHAIHLFNSDLQP
jgi:hypothetical protein